MGTVLTPRIRSRPHGISRRNSVAVVVGCGVATVAATVALVSGGDAPVTGAGVPPPGRRATVAATVATPQPTAKATPLLRRIGRGCERMRGVRTVLMLTS